MVYCADDTLLSIKQQVNTKEYNFNIISRYWTCIPDRRYKAENSQNDPGEFK